MSTAATFFAQLGKGEPLMLPRKYDVLEVLLAALGVQPSG